MNAQLGGSDLILTHECTWSHGGDVMVPIKARLALPLPQGNGSPTSPRFSMVLCYVPAISQPGPVTLDEFLDLSASWISSSVRGEVALRVCRGSLWLSHPYHCYPPLSPNPHGAWSFQLLPDIPSHQPLPTPSHPCSQQLRLLVSQETPFCQRRPEHKKCNPSSPSEPQPPSPPSGAQRSRPVFN